MKRYARQLLALAPAAMWAACRPAASDEGVEARFDAEGAGSQERPNILWIVSEDNSPFLGSYGDDFATTPHLDRLAEEGVRYERAFANAPVCAPARSTLITGVSPTSMGTEHMRSEYPLPELIRFFPEYLRNAGYYTTNNAKTDYNTSVAEARMRDAWDESSSTATYADRAPGQPFFAVFNTSISHESSLHEPVNALTHDPERVPIPPYHPRTPEMEWDWAQYYDKITEMDAWVGQLLQELEDAGLADETIVFYYGDHGGVLGRSKRYLYESGLRVPLIIRFPEKYAHLAPGEPGTRVDRIVTFADFAPTALSLAGIPVPDYMQGRPFLGGQEADPETYAFGLRGRMDERLDLSRTVRDERYRYIRHYMPHKIDGQYIEYLWRAPSMRSWEAAYRAGSLDSVQAAFWEPKSAEVLYDVDVDPHNVRNLAGDPAYREVLERLREAGRQWSLETRDVGFIPEAMITDIAEETPLYDYARSGRYGLERILETASMASSRDARHLDVLVLRLEDDDPVVRYWAATGCTVLGEEAASARAALHALLADQEASVRIAAAEALHHLGEAAGILPTLTGALANDNLMVRVQALNVLETMGDEAAPALAAITALVPDDPVDYEYDSRAARRLVEQLSSP